MIVTSVNGKFNPNLHVHIHNFSPLTSFKDIKANLVDKLVAVKGTIIRVGGIRSMIMKMTFQCELCQACSSIVFSYAFFKLQTFVDGKYQTPTQCGVNGCRSRLLKPIRQTAVSQDWQVIKYRLKNNSFVDCRSVVKQT